MIKYDGEIFEGSDAHLDVLWWAIHLLGGEIVIPEDTKFWDDNFPDDAILTMFKRDGKLILAAERVSTLTKQLDQPED